MDTSALSAADVLLPRRSGPGSRVETRASSAFGGRRGAEERARVDDALASDLALGSAAPLASSALTASPPGHVRAGSSRALVGALQALQEKVHQLEAELAARKKSADQLAEEYRLFREESQRERDQRATETREEEARARSALGRAKGEAQALRLRLEEKDQELDALRRSLDQERATREASEALTAQLSTMLGRVEQALREKEVMLQQREAELDHAAQAQAQSDQRRIVAEARADALTARIASTLPGGRDSAHTRSRSTRGAASGGAGSGAGAGAGSKTGARRGLKKSRRAGAGAGAGAGAHSSARVSDLTVETLEARRRGRELRLRPWLEGEALLDLGAGGDGALASDDAAAAASAAAARRALEQTRQRTQTRVVESVGERLWVDERSRSRSAETREPRKARGASGRAGGATIHDQVVAANGGRLPPFLAAGASGPTHNVIGNLQMAISRPEAYGARSERESGRGEAGEYEDGRLPDEADEDGLSEDAADDEEEEEDNDDDREGGEEAGAARNGTGSQGAAWGGDESARGGVDKAAGAFPPRPTAGRPPLPPSGSAGSSSSSSYGSSVGGGVSSLPPTPQSSARPLGASSLSTADTPPHATPRGSSSSSSFPVTSASSSASASASTPAASSIDLERAHRLLESSAALVAIHEERARLGRSRSRSPSPIGTAHNVSSATSTSASFLAPPSSASSSSSSSTFGLRGRSEDPRGARGSSQQLRGALAGSSAADEAALRDAVLRAELRRASPSPAPSSAGASSHVQSRRNSAGSVAGEGPRAASPRLVAHRTVGPERDVRGVIAELEREFETLEQQYTDLLARAERSGETGKGAVADALQQLLGLMREKGRQLHTLRAAAHEIVEARERSPLRSPEAARARVEALRTFQHMRVLADSSNGGPATAEHHHRMTIPTAGRSIGPSSFELADSALDRSLNSSSRSTASFPVWEPARRGAGRSGTSSALFNDLEERPLDASVVSGGGPGQPAGGTFRFVRH